MGVRLAWLHDEVRPFLPVGRCQQGPTQGAHVLGLGKSPKRLHPVVEGLRARQDRLQAEHGKPIPPRIPSQQLYNMLGTAYRRLGRYPEALDAFRYGRGMAPAAPDGYDNAAATYDEMGDAARAAVVELEKALALGTTPQAVRQLVPWYRKLPVGACAVAVQSGIAMLNPGCPRIQADLCRALPELGGTFLDARQPARAAEFDRMAQPYGCPRE